MLAICVRLKLHFISATLQNIYLLSWFVEYLPNHKEQLATTTMTTSHENRWERMTMLLGGRQRRRRCKLRLRRQRRLRLRLRLLTAFEPVCRILIQLRWKVGGAGAGGGGEWQLVWIEQQTLWQATFSLAAFSAGLGESFASQKQQPGLTSWTPSRAEGRLMRSLQLCAN